ncbi:MAG TPA: 30S ribosomal protein S17 [Firmicutes bacterium]|nr:30S ribosomal protein S17 [Bacillota bacterium]
MSEREHRKTVSGVVVSDKMDKVITVQIETRKKHPLYQKYIKAKKKIKAQDSENSCKVGDTVRLMETRPLAKTVRWRVVEILKKA